MDELEKIVREGTRDWLARKDYDQWVERRVWQERYRDNEIKFLIDEFPGLKGFKILEVGSGSGGFIVAMRRRGYDIIGLEPSSDYRQITALRAARYDLDVDVLAAQGEHLPLPDKTFDLIYSNDVLEHVLSPESVLTEMKRVLKDDGAIYVTIINRFAWLDPHYHLFGINWLPRFLGERLVKILAGSKDVSRATDKQKLSELNYFTWSGFNQLARRLGLAVDDVREAKLDRPGALLNKRAAAILRILNANHLTTVVYKFMRFFVFNEFHVILRVNSKSKIQGSN